jgi:RES domain-containing protein
MAVELPTTTRGGSYFRVCKPDWLDPADTSFSKTAGGRWNPPGEFGALYLNATIRVAAAQARQQHAGRAIGLFDLRPERRPSLATFDVHACVVVDAVTDGGIRALRLPPRYPAGVPWPPCQRIGRRAFRERHAGVAARSAAEARPGEWVGEELAYFDSQPRLRAIQVLDFQSWYPDARPT